MKKKNKQTTKQCLYTQTLTPLNREFMTVGTLASLSWQCRGVKVGGSIISIDISSCHLTASEL